MRKSNLERKTKETQIKLELNLDGSGNYDINTPIILFNHMLSTFVKHSNIDLKLDAIGDSAHHIIEDTAIALAKAFDKALGDKMSIERFGEALIPMDESLIQIALDLGGRSYYIMDGNFKRLSLDDLAIEDILHFLETFANNLKINLHIKILYGKNDHHKLEAVFKALAISFKRAIKINEKTTIPSTKGVL